MINGNDVVQQRLKWVEVFMLYTYKQTVNGEWCQKPKRLCYPFNKKKAKIFWDFWIREIEFGKRVYWLAESEEDRENRRQPWRILLRTFHLMLTTSRPIPLTALILPMPLFLPPLSLALLFVFLGLPVTPLPVPSWAPFSAMVIALSFFQEFLHLFLVSYSVFLNWGFGFWLHP